MNIINKIAVACFISFAMTATLASQLTVHPNKVTAQEINNWKFTKADDGMIFILGEYTEKLLEIHTNAILANGAAADAITILCNADNETVYRKHRLDPGSSITCKGSMNDVASMSVASADFKNGAEGTYEFKAIA